MRQCKNCGKEIPDTLTFCSKNCTEDYKRKSENSELFKMELDLLENSVGKEVELGLSRGSNVKGIVTHFDQKYAKIAVKVKENNRTKTVIVRLGYVISCAIYE